MPSSRTSFLPSVMFNLSQFADALLRTVCRFSLSTAGFVVCSIAIGTKLGTGCVGLRAGTFMTVMTDDCAPLRNSTLYQEYLAERAEILKHKWIESEKAGHDIGFEQALADWILNHRQVWLKHRRAQRLEANLEAPTSSSSCFFQCSG